MHLYASQAYAKGDYHAALDHFTAAIKIEPSNVAARNNRALSYLKLNMYAEAAVDCDVVLKADCNNVKALLRRAAAFEGLGRQHEAVGDLQFVLRLQPNNADAKEKLAALSRQSAENAGVDIGENVS